MPLTLEEFGREFVKRRQAARSCLNQEMTGFFVGAGLEYGFAPGWDELVKDLLKECKVVVPPGPWSNPQKADMAKKQDAVAYKRVILKHFRRWSALTQKITPLMRDLNLHSVVTTNYSNDLLTALRAKNFTKIILPNFTNQDAARPNHVFYIHGYIDEYSSDDFNIILSEEEYERNYGFAGIVKSFLLSYFQQLNVIFIGFSFEDSHVVEILSEVSELERQHVLNSPKSFRPVQRFALMGIKVEKDRKRRQFLDFEYIQKTEEKLKNLNIVPVWYDSTGSHQQLYNIVADWIEGSSAQEGLSEAVI